LEVATEVPLLTIAEGYPDNLYKNLAPSQTESLFQQSPSQTGVSMPSPTGSYTATYTINLAGRYIRGTPAQIQFLSTKDVAYLLTSDPMDARRIWVTPVINASIPDTTWNITKFPTGVVPGINPGSNSYYQTLLRASEMYLTVAEASAKIGDENTANEYLNVIRQRANPSVSSTTVSGPALLDSIYTERRKEMAFEGIRMFDLLRWKKGVFRYDALNAMAQNLPYPHNKAIAPIPAPDVDINHLQQNPGY
jgi:starch-binding outer membrane protein, SusD/RagB family